MTETPPDQTDDQQPADQQTADQRHVERQRVSHWDRPKPPHDWRWVVGGVGRTLITLGLLMFGFVAYQLWGTGIQTAQAQRELSAQFDKLVNHDESTSPTTIAAPTTVPPSTSPATTIGGPPATDAMLPTTTTLPALPAAQPLPDQGEAVARLEIPRMDLNRIVVEGATAGDLAKGPGHFPETPLPGQLGNAAIAGHRTTHLHPFYDIDALQPGDEIIVTTLNGRYVYAVTGTVVVSPDDYDAVIPTKDPTRATLTLVSCTPRYSSSKRIVVHSELVVDQSDALTAAAPPSAGTSGATLPDDSAVTTDAVATTTASTTPAVVVTTPATTPATSAASAPATTAVAGDDTAAATSPDAFADGWFSDTSAVPQTLLWAVLLAAIAYGALLLSRRVRRYWVGVLAAFVPFIVVLYFFYENVNRLLPPNL